MLTNFAPYAWVLLVAPLVRRGTRPTPVPTAASRLATVSAYLAKGTVTERILSKHLGNVR